jgi:DNA repair exonuclease SbcCD ATPase subunit
MRVEFLRLVARNFLSWKNLDFSFPSNGVTLFMGENGAGKSGVFEALFWCLYGKTLRDIPVGDIVTRGEREGTVAVWFYIESINRTYFVNRVRLGTSSSSSSLYLKSKEGKILDHSTGGWDDEGRSTIVATTQRIKEILGGVSSFVFQNSICHAQGLPYRFLQSSESEKRELFEQILNLGWVASAKAKVLEYIKIIDQTSRELASTQRMEEAVYRAHEANLGNLIRRNLDPRELAVLRLRKDFLKDELGKLEAERNLLLSATEVGNAELGKIRFVVERVRGLVSDQSAKVFAFKTEVNRIEAQRREYNETVGGGLGTCPLCRRLLEGDERKAVRKEIIERVICLDRRLTSLIYDLELVEGQLNCTTEILDTNEKLGKEKEGELIKNETLLQNNYRAAISVNSQIDNVNHTIVVWEQVAATFEEQRRKLEETLEQSRIAGEELRAVSDRLRVLRSLADIWGCGFGPRGLKSELINSVALPFLNARAEAYSALTNSRFSVAFDAIQDEDGARLKIKAASVLGIDYSGMSGGEKRRVDVVVLLTLHDLVLFLLGVDFNFQVFDEVFENVDAEGVETLLGILKDRANQRAVFLISHTADIVSEVDTTVIIRKNSEGESVMIRR